MIKSLYSILLTLLISPLMSLAAWDSPINYQLISGPPYHNKELHLYDGNHVNNLLLTGSSFLSVSGPSLLNDAIASNNSNIHLYTFNGELSEGPIINNSQFNDNSILTMESLSRSSGELSISEYARLNITHVDKDSGNIFLKRPEVIGDVHIEKLNLAGRAFISATAILADDYDDNDYLKEPGEKIITRIDDLIMQPGSLLSMQEYAPHLQFNQLQINRLSGSGVFIMGSHLAGGLSDNLIVREQATGRFGLAIADSGHNAVTPQRITLVSVNHGDAHFELLNRDGIVEVGTWQYRLQHDTGPGGTEWYLSNSGPNAIEGDAEAVAARATAERQSCPHQPLPASLAATVPLLSHSAEAIINMASASRYIQATEMSNLPQRMGDKPSLWVHYLKDNNQLTGYQDRLSRRQLQGIQSGLSHRTELSQGRWLLGVLFSDSKTRVQSGGVSNGNIRSRSGGLYTTWIDNSGLYWDILFKLNQFHSQVRTPMYSGRITQGQYHQHGLSVASESGYPLHWPPGFTVTPYGKLSYFRTSKARYLLDNGMEAILPQATNLDAEAGLLLATEFSLAGYHLRPYLKVALLHELFGNNQVTINNSIFNLPDTGTRAQYGCGGSLDLAKNVEVWSEMSYQKGSKTESAFNTHAGLRISF